MPPTPGGPTRSRTSRRAPTTPGRLGWSSSGSTVDARWWTRSSSRVSSRSNIASTTMSVWWAAIPTVPSDVAAGVDLLVARQAAPKAAVASRSPVRVLVVPSVTAARPVSAPRPASARSAWWAVTARVLEDLRRPGRAGPRVCRSENPMRGHVLVLLAGRGLGSGPHLDSSSPWPPPRRDARSAPWTAGDLAVSCPLLRLPTGPPRGEHSGPPRAAARRLPDGRRPAMSARTWGREHGEPAARHTGRCWGSD